MPEVDEIKQDVMDTVDSDLDAWESFYKKFKGDYGKISEYEKRIESLEEEIGNRDAHLKRKLEKEKGTLLVFTAAFLIASALLLRVLTNSLNVWLYFASGVLIGLGAFSLLYLWTR